MFRTAFATIVGAVLLVTSASAQMMPTLTIVNQAGDAATVKVVGPTAGIVDVPSGGDQTVSLSGGVYELRIRYCNASGCRYTRTDSFVVTQTPYAVSRTTITLHSIGGNLGEKPITATEFQG